MPRPTSDQVTLFARPICCHTAMRVPDLLRTLGRPAVKLDNHWLPFTPNRDFTRPEALSARRGRPLCTRRRARGCSTAARPIHQRRSATARKEIAEAVYKQLLELDFVSSFQRSSSQERFEAAERVPRA